MSIAFPLWSLPGSPSLRMGRRASPSIVIVINDRRQLVSQFGWWIRVLGVASRRRVLAHVVLARRACSHREGVNRNRL